MAAFSAGTIPATITSAGGDSEPVSVFACSSITPGFDRFGFVSDSKSLTTNTVAGAVAPSGAGTVQGTVNGLNALGIRVIGMGPSAAPTTATGPSSDPSVFMSGLGRLTGALDSMGNPLVFSTSTPLADLSTAIANAITTTATKPVDIEIATSPLPAGLTVTPTPAVVNGVSPGGTANFTLTLKGSGSPISGGFDVQFKDKASGALLGTIPATVDCKVVDSTPPSCTVGTAVKGVVTVIAQDTGSGLALIKPTTVVNAKVTAAAFTPGTTAPVNITVSQTKPLLSSLALISISDQAGNVTACEVVTIVVVPKSCNPWEHSHRKPGEHFKPGENSCGKPGEHSYGGVHRDKHHVKIKHVDHGVTRIEVEVDGKTFSFKTLRDGESIDISSAYKSDKDNSLIVRVYGTIGAAASVGLTK